MFYLLLFLCVLCMIWLWSATTDSEPPDISGRLPLIGHGHLVPRGYRGLYNAIQRISEECLEKDGVVKIYLGPIKLYGVANPEDSLTILNTCLQKHYFYNYMKPVTGNGLLTADLPTWRKHRKLLNPAFNQQVLLGFVGVFNSQAQKLVNHFADNLNKEFDQEEILRKNSLETICLTATGINADDYGNLQKQYLPSLEKLLQICNRRVIEFWLHNDFLYKWSNLKKTEDVALRHLTALTKSLLQKKKSEMSKPEYIENNTGKPQPFLDLILELAKNNSSFTDEHIQAEINTMLAAGHDTNSTTLTIALTLLGSNLSVQEKAFDEISQVFGNSKRDVHQEDLAKLVYIEAILKETLRLYSIAPVILRQLENDIKLRNYTLKANSDCIISIYGLHRHKMWGTDASEFKPDRWLDKDTLPDPKYFAAFGLGRRSCIGKTYAMMSMKINLVHILRRYRISSNVNKMALQMTTLLRPSSGFYIGVEQRNI